MTDEEKKRALGNVVQLMEQAMEDLIKIRAESPEPAPCMPDWLGTAEILLDETITTIHRYQDEED